MSGDRDDSGACQLAAEAARSSVPVLGIGQDQRITVCNAEVEELLGQQELVGRHCYEVLEGEDPFGNSYCGPHCPIVRAVATGQPPRAFVLRVRTAAGMRPLRFLPLFGGSSAIECHAYVVAPLADEAWVGCGAEG